MKKKISIIIPYFNNNNNIKIEVLLKKILVNEYRPNEVLLIYSNQKKLSISNLLLNEFNKKKILFKIFYKKKMYPGEARNYGILMSKNNIVGFLDINTEPDKKWILKGIMLLKKNDIIWGQTISTSSNLKEKIFRAATLGSHTLLTVPGTIMKKKEVLTKCGLFIEEVRAGEDGDFIERTKLQNIKNNKNSSKIIYTGLQEMTLFKLIKKWYLYYSHGKLLPHVNKQIKLYYWVLTIGLIIISLNWNSIVAEWDINRESYIPNITKKSLFFITTLYVLIRGIIFPLIKKEKFFFIFPINFLAISFISFLLDFTKLLAFFTSKKKLNNKI